MVAEKSWEDQAWTKTTYQRQPIWEEVGSQIEMLTQITCESQDMRHLDGVALYQAVARQVVLVIYSNLQHRFDPDSKQLKELTASQQSHWNFMLLGKLGPSRWNGSTEEAERIEQPVTRYFLCKLIHRLRLHGWDINWKAIEDELSRGSRWRVLSSPASSEPRARWAKDFGSVMPSLDYPSPWSIANRYKVTVDHPEPVEVEQLFEDAKMRERKIWPCRVQNDGIFLIRPGAAIEMEGTTITATNLWVIDGLEPPTTLDEDYEKQNTTRLIDLLKQSMRRVDELELQGKADAVEIGALSEMLEEAHEEIARLKKQMASPVDLRIVIDPVTGAVTHIS